MCEIEGTLRTGTDMPHIKYNKEEVEGHKLKIEVILGTLSAPSSPGFDKNLRMGERAPHLAPISPHYAPTTSVSESGTSLAPPSPILYGMPIAPPHPRFSFLNFNSLYTFDRMHIRSA